MCLSVCLSGLNLLIFLSQGMQGLICVEFDKNAQVKSYDEKAAVVEKFPGSIIN